MTLGLPLSFWFDRSNGPTGVSPVITYRIANAANDGFLRNAANDGYIKNANG